MKYFKIKITPKTQSVEHTAAVLSSIGYDNIIIEDSKDIREILDGKDTHIWDYIDESLLDNEDDRPSVTLYVNTNSEADAVREALKDHDLTVETADDAEWKDKYKEHFKPIKVTEDIVVKPTWEKYTGHHETVIEIDPGMAFGTGTHPTTAMCIRLLEKYIKKEYGRGCPDGGNDVKKGGMKLRVLDVGCGSGILSIAAAKLGADEVIAVDIDPEAVRITGENAGLNGVGNKIDVREGDIMKGLFAAKGTAARGGDEMLVADVAVANLMAELIVGLKDDMKDHIKSGGVFICSGIISGKEQMVENALSDSGYEVLDRLREDEWCALALRLL